MTLTTLHSMRIELDEFYLRALTNIPYCLLQKKQIQSIKNMQYVFTFKQSQKLLICINFKIQVFIISLRRNFVNNFAIIENVNKINFKQICKMTNEKIVLSGRFRVYETKYLY